ncbi:MAG: iron-containing alcohol dehydrogenase, partial [Phaeodactylibacter sp.]|nr:iron-containing alcohol dehydrogenase [Phaeodactylibacter sp.]
GLRPDKVFIVADETVSGIYKEVILGTFQSQFRCAWVSIAPGETEKNITTISSLCSQILASECTRKSIIVPLGGGVIGNIAGLAASLLFRGIRLVHMPTTLLAMHDSVTSCKQAVNHASSKNILGAYYSPEAILADTAFLATLPEKHIRSGKGELVKNALIFGGRQYQEVLMAISGETSEENLIRMVELGVEAKSSLLHLDPFEKQQAIIFEYGHTIGHGIELSCKGELSHGESIALGMKYAAVISNAMGLLPNESLDIHQQLIAKLQPAFPAEKPDRAAIMRYVMNDNKRGYIPTAKDEVPMILLRGIGEVAADKEHHYLSKVPVALLNKTLSNL